MLEEQIVAKKPKIGAQKPSNALGSNIAKILIQQCATYIFLANLKANYEDYTKGFKLTNTEF